MLRAAMHGRILHLHTVVLSSCWVENVLYGSIKTAIVFWRGLLSVRSNASMVGGGEVVAGK